MVSDGVCAALKATEAERKAARAGDATDQQTIVRHDAFLKNAQPRDAATVSRIEILINEDANFLRLVCPRLGWRCHWLWRFGGAFAHSPSASVIVAGLHAPFCAVDARALRDPTGFAYWIPRRRALRAAVAASLRASASHRHQRRRNPKTSEHPATLTSRPDARKTPQKSTMKLKLPAPVKVQGPSGETIEVSAAQVIEHVVRTGRELGASSDVAQVRTGARILAAVASGDIAEADLAELRKVLARPSRGWVAIEVEIDVPVPPGSPPRSTKRLLTPSAIDLLPILDGLGV